MVVVSFFRYFYVGVSVVLINLFWTFKYFIYGIYSFLKFLFSLFVFFGKGVSVSIKPITEIPDKIEENKLKKMKEKRDEELFEASKIKYGYSELKEEEEVPLFKKLQNLPNSIKSWFNKKYSNLSFVKYFKNKQIMEQQELLIDFESDDAIRTDVKKMFIYKAKNPEGKIIKESFAAYSKVDVHSYLLSEGYEVYEIEESKIHNLFGFAMNFSKKKVKMKDLIFWTAQLSTYIKAGIPLVDSIKILSTQTKKRSHKTLFQSIIYELVMGNSFSEALDKQGKAFPRLFINMMKAAEMTGELPETLDDMEDYYTAIEKTRKQILSALTYPAIIFIMSAAVITFILMFVVPKFVSIYADLGTSLPPVTVFIINISKFLKSNYIYIFIILIVLISVIKVAYDSVKFFRTIMQWIIMKMPFFGNAIIYKEVSMFSKTFSALQRNSIFISDSMSVLSKITNNEMYKMLILDTITNLGKGEKISTAFKDSWAFPNIAYQMLLTGEKTGQTAEMMSKVADYYQEEQKNLVTRMKALIEPLTIVFLAIVVGIILLAVITPMFQMYNTMSQLSG